jgi:hypothetical protein
MKANILFLSYLAQFFLEWEIFFVKSVEEIKIHILGLITTFSKIVLLWDNVEKYFIVGQIKDDNKAHAHSMLDTQGYKHTLRVCNTLCSSTATMVARMRLIVTLYVYCVSCLFYFCIFGWQAVRRFILNRMFADIALVQSHWDREYNIALFFRFPRH